MDKISLDKNWLFHIETNEDETIILGFRKTLANKYAAKGCSNLNWRKVDIPHDWGIEIPFDRYCENGKVATCRLTWDIALDERKRTDGVLYNIGWYRKEFFIDDKYKDKRIFIEFDGIYRNSAIFINGIDMHHHLSGYTSFCVDITDCVLFGENNTVAVRVDAGEQEGWWYEGAGIYRHVRLAIADNLYIPQNESYIIPEINGTVTVNTAIINNYDLETDYTLLCEIRDANNNLVARESVSGNIFADDSARCSVKLHIDNPSLWDIESPYLYKAELKLISCDSALQTEIIKFGFREFIFDCDKGFFLNKKPVKIKGVCCHQDFAGVGNALPDKLQYYKINKLKGMGVNAYRCAHNPPTPELLDACDELGMLVLDEQRLFSSSKEVLGQLKSLVMRDRNHPCVFAWSIGNEEAVVQNNATGKKIATAMINTIKKYDATRTITYGGNNGPNYDGINETVELRGINYIRLFEKAKVDDYHNDHPKQCIIGTEEASVFCARGVYEDDLTNRLLSGYSLNTMSWGSTPKGWWKFYDERDYICGGFIWTGFDYKGEPAPFARENTSSHFGVIDLCGFPKDPYYYYKSWWTNEPVLHILPAWNYKAGDRVKVCVYSNCDNVELFVNEKSYGKKTMIKNDDLCWEVTYEEGFIKAVGEKDGEIVTALNTTPTEASAISLIPDKDQLSLDEEISVIKVEIKDTNDNVHPTADNMVYFDIEGDGEIIGVGNGNPTSTEPERFIKKVVETDIEKWFIIDGENKIPTGVNESNTLNYYDPSYQKPIPEGANELYRDDMRIVWSVESNAPIDTIEYETELTTSCETKYIEFNRLYGDSEVYLNGEKIGSKSMVDYRPHRFYGNFKEGKNVIRVKCFAPNDQKIGIYNSARIGRFEKALWHRKAFNGLALVLIKANGKGEIKIKAHSKGLSSAETSITVI